MQDPDPLSIRTSTDVVKATDSVIIYNDQIVHRYSVLLQALNSQGDVVEPVTDDLSATNEIERKHFLHLVGEHRPTEKYKVQRTISTGGMGRLYYVHDIEFQRNTAMKVILPELKHDSAMVKSFVYEARVTSQLEHPNIIPVHDLGFLPDYGIYFTMKYVDGESLHDLLIRLESADADALERYDYFNLLNIFRKICDAVAFAHSKGVLHRDIKPHNIMVGNFGEVLLMDWGLARTQSKPRTRKKVPRGLSSTLLGPGNDEHPMDEMPGRAPVVKGSPGYMSPEQAAGLNDQLDERSDVFLLGATLYHMFTFFPPYLGTTIEEVLESALACDYLPPETVAFGDLEIPAEICRIMQKAMAPFPADRYQNVPELINDLDALLHGRMHSEKRRFAAGEALMVEGEFGHECYIITEGEVEIFKTTDSGKVVLGRQGKGDIVGEMAIITHAPRSASVFALSDTEVVVMTEKTFEQNINKLPAWMARTILTLAQRLSATNSRLADSTRHNGG